jgi:flagellar motor switch protein FliG
VTVAPTARDEPPELPSGQDARRRAAAIVLTQIGPAAAAAVIDELSAFERDALLFEVTRLGHVTAFERDRVLDDFSSTFDRSA